MWLTGAGQETDFHVATATTLPYCCRFTIEASGLLIYWLVGTEHADPETLLSQATDLSQSAGPSDLDVAHLIGLKCTEI